MIPVTDKTLFLKQVDFSSRSYNGFNLVDLVFPSFKEPIMKREDFLWRVFGKEAKEYEKSYPNDVVFKSENRRRYDGGEHLERSCYYTVCNELNGNDRCTLRNELYGYNHFEYSGPIRVFDFAVESSMERFHQYQLNYRAAHPGVYIMGMDNGVRRYPFINRWLEHDLYTLHSPRAPHLRFAVAHFPYKVEEVHCQNILDLRERKAQDWLIEELKSYDIEDNKFKGETAHDWFYVLSLIMDDLHGGNIVTSRIGATLRNAGVKGLVFPSARSNCAVNYQNGEVSDFRGWNFVRYDTSIVDYDRKIEGATVTPRFEVDWMDLSASIDDGWHLEIIERQMFKEIDEQTKRALS